MSASPGGKKGSSRFALKAPPAGGAGSKAPGATGKTVEAYAREHGVTIAVLKTANPVLRSYRDTQVIPPMTLKALRIPKAAQQQDEDDTPPTPSGSTSFEEADDGPSSATPVGTPGRPPPAGGMGGSMRAAGSGTSGDDAGGRPSWDKVKTVKAVNAAPRKSLGRSLGRSDNTVGSHTGTPGAKPERQRVTIMSLAIKHEFSPDEIRGANAALAELADEDTIPAGTKIQLPKRTRPRLSTQIAVLEKQETKERETLDSEYGAAVADFNQAKRDLHETIHLLAEATLQRRHLLLAGVVEDANFDYVGVDGGKTDDPDFTAAPVDDLIEAMLQTAARADAVHWRRDPATSSSTTPAARHVDAGAAVSKPGEAALGPAAFSPPASLRMATDDGEEAADDKGHDEADKKAAAPSSSSVTEHGDEHQPTTSLSTPPSAGRSMADDAAVDGEAKRTPTATGPGSNEESSSPVASVSPGEARSFANDDDDAHDSADKDRADDGDVLVMGVSQALVARADGSRGEFGTPADSINIASGTHYVQKSQSSTPAAAAAGGGFSAGFAQSPFAGIVPMLEAAVADAVAKERRSLLEANQLTLRSLLARKAKLRALENALDRKMEDIHKEAERLRLRHFSADNTVVRMAAEREESDARMDIHRDESYERAAVVGALNRELLGALREVQSARWEHQVRMAAGARSPGGRGGAPVHLSVPSRRGQQQAASPKSGAAGADPEYVIIATGDETPQMTHVDDADEHELSHITIADETAATTTVGLVTPPTGTHNAHYLATTPGGAVPTAPSPAPSHITIGGDDTATSAGVVSPVSDRDAQLGDVPSEGRDGDATLSGSISGSGVYTDAQPPPAARPAAGQQQAQEQQRKPQGRHGFKLDAEGSKSTEDVGHDDDDDDAVTDSLITKQHVTRSNAAPADQSESRILSPDIADTDDADNAMTMDRTDMSAMVSGRTSAAHEVGDERRDASSAAAERDEAKQRSPPADETPAAVAEGGGGGRGPAPTVDGTPPPVPVVVGNHTPPRSSTPRQPPPEPADANNDTASTAPPTPSDAPHGDSVAAAADDDAEPVIEDEEDVPARPAREADWAFDFLPAAAAGTTRTSASTAGANDDYDPRIARSTMTHIGLAPQSRCRAVIRQALDVRGGIVALSMKLHQRPVAPAAGDVMPASSSAGLPPGTLTPAPPVSKMQTAAQRRGLRGKSPTRPKPVRCALQLLFAAPNAAFDPPEGSENVPLVSFDAPPEEPFVAPWCTLRTAARVAFPAPPETDGDPVTFHASVDMGSRMLVLRDADGDVVARDGRWAIEAEHVPASAFVAVVTLAGTGSSLTLLP